MTDIDKIKQVLYQFIHNGLVSKSVEGVLNCIDEQVLGIGLGEQGIVKSHQDIRAVLKVGAKSDPPFSHIIKYGMIDVLVHSKDFASVCAEVIVIPQNKDADNQTKSKFMQMLTVHKKDEEWKICALHASTPVITEEDIEAYPLKFAEKTLQSLRKKIGEEVYMIEDQYRKAILADTIAFYIINLTKNIFEKCQYNNDLCARVEPGVPYDQFITDNSSGYIIEEDREKFINIFNSENLKSAYENGVNEITFEYRLITNDNAYIWVVNVIRFITDVETGEQKGIMYVRDISKSKEEELSLLAKASSDSMTGLYNKATAIKIINELIQSNQCDGNGILLMFDVDNFKLINDTFGHPVGDEVLIKVADSLKTAFVSSSIISRLGGDEFCVFIPQILSKSELNETIKHFQKLIQQLTISHAEILHISCSIGVVECESATCFKDMYVKADKALYLSKKSGKNKVSFFSHS